MATYNKATGTSGTLRINVTSTQTASSNSTMFSFSFQIINTSGSTFVNGLGWSANAAGVGNSGSVNISGTGTYTLWSSNRGPFTHDSNGNLSAKTFSMHMNGSGTQGLGGPTDHSASVTAPRIPKAPGAPGTPTVDTVTDTDVTLDWTAASRGHANITDYGVYVSTSSSFSSHVYQAWVGLVLTKKVTGLTPGTTYYARVRAINGDGTGPYSGTRSFLTAPARPTGLAASAITPSGFTVKWTATPTATGYDLQYSTASNFSGAPIVATTSPSRDLTGLNPGTTYYVRVRAKNGSGAGDWSTNLITTTLPASAPGMAVTAGPTGTTATVTLTPPSGATGVTKYTVERRTTGTTTPVTTYNPTTSPLNVTGLTPGRSYQWRASAWFDDYQSPFTDWVTVQQPQPNTSPGDYFDGSTPDRPDIDFQWTGTVNNSTSIAVGRGVTGWSVGQGTARAVVQQITGGRSQAFAARLQIIADATAAGVSVGMAGGSAGAYSAEVVEGATYVGSMFVIPSRAQRLHAYLTWYDAAGATIGGTSDGEGVLVTDIENWTRLVVTGEAPAGATHATARVRDIAGDDWAPWLSGEHLDADDAMVTLSSLVPYFDGSFPDTATAFYDWLAAPNASASSLTTVANASYDPLADPDCPPIPLPPVPPIVLDDCIIEVGTWRRYWVTVPADEVNEWLATIPTLHLRSGASAVRQIRIRVYANPTDSSPGAFDASNWESEQIVSYLPPQSLLTLDGPNERVWARVGSDTVDPATLAPIAADRLLYGTNGTPATWPVLDCGDGYLISLDVPLDADSGNLSAAIELTKRML